MIRALIAAVRRFFARRAARRLLAQRLPRGVRAPSLALAAPVQETPPGEYRTLALLGRRPELLLRLSALPAPPYRLDVVEPRKLRLDADFRLPPEVEPLPRRELEPRPLRIRPRSPLARAPLHRLDPRKFRLDPRTQAPANEGIVPLAPADPSYRWISPAFRRRHLELPWMAQDRIRFLGPMHAEWFLMWWDQTMQEGPGAREPRTWERPDEVEWALEECKEQMLIRRDVVKDEQPPEEQELSATEMEHPLVAWDPVPVPQLVPPKEWVEIADPQALAPAPPLERRSREAYLEWRTLMDALGES
jgi:hypothetical protein